MKKPNYPTVTATVIDKERIERLEQVARDMWRWIDGVEREYPRMLGPNRKPGGQLVYPMPSEGFAWQLTELGVSLDG